VREYCTRGRGIVLQAPSRLQEASSTPIPPPSPVFPRSPRAAGFASCRKPRCEYGRKHALERCLRRGLRGSTCRTRSQDALPPVMQLRRRSLLATICYSSILKSMSFISFLEVPSLVGLAVEGRRKAPWSFCGVRHSEITVLKSPPMCIQLRVGNGIYLTDTAYWTG
jgi:hypothetical protein